MANEARVQTYLSIVKLSSTGVRIVDYRQPASSFIADVTGSKGPTPGALAISQTGTDILFSELTTPGFCKLTNQDGTNYVEVGIRDPLVGFYPLMEIGPGESYVVKLTRNLGEQYTGTGTGTTSPVNFLHAVANGASLSLLVEAFER